MVITGVAGRLASRIKALVCLDVFVPKHGQSLTDLLRIALPAEVAAVLLGSFHTTALENHSGLMAPIPAEMFGIKAENRAWVDRRCAGQPLATFEMPLLLAGAGAAVPQRLYILADGWGPSPFRHFAAKFSGQPGWRITKLASSHDAMVDMPVELAAALMALA